MSAPLREPCWDYRLEPPAARVICESESKTRYTLDIGDRDFRMELSWQPPQEEGDIAKFTGVECLYELDDRGERLSSDIRPSMSKKAKRFVADVFNRRWESKEFQKRIREFAQRWHDEGY